MTKRLLMFCVLAQAISLLPAQKTPSSKEPYVITNLQKDSVNERTRAAITLRNLINGSVIIRLKTNQKSVDAYRKAGQHEIADRIEAERKLQNQKIYSAFVHNFNFCKTYFIYANETRDLLNGTKG